MEYQSLMSYQFFLFIKLYEVFFENELPYDEYFDKLRGLYLDWMEWDGNNGIGIGTYESIEKWIKSVYLGKHLNEIENK